MTFVEVLGVNKRLHEKWSQRTELETQEGLNKQPSFKVSPVHTSMVRPPIKC